jgi:hypothetical protein
VQCGYISTPVSLLGQIINTQKTQAAGWPTAKSANTKAQGNKMASSSYFILAVFLALASSQAIASDPSPLQDFCVADKHSPGIYLHLFDFL